MCKRCETAWLWSQGCPRLFVTFFFLSIFPSFFSFQFYSFLSIAPNSQEERPNLDERCCISYKTDDNGELIGVGISQRGILNVVMWMHRHFDISPDDRHSQIYGLHDAHNLLLVYEVMSMLTAGASVHIYDEKDNEGTFMPTSFITVVYLDNSLHDRCIGYMNSSFL